MNLTRKKRRKPLFFYTNFTPHYEEVTSFGFCVPGCSLLDAQINKVIVRTDFGKILEFRRQKYVFA